MTTAFPPTDKPDAGYLLKLELENIRCFGDKQTLDLCAPGTADRPARWTIILGENGTGKTTLLQVTFLGRHPPKKVSKLYTNKIDLSFIRRINEKKGFIRAIHPFKNGSKAHNIFDKNKENEDEIHEDIKFIQITSNRNHLKDLTLSYGANRRITYHQNYQATQGHETLFSEDYGLRSPGEWFSAALGATFGQGVEAYQRVEKHYKRLLEALPELLPNVSAVRVENLNNKLELWFKTDFGEVTIEQLSAGYRAMAAWVVDLASHMFNAYPESADPLSEPAVVLVDEFDLHLHPKWQREAIGFLTERFPAVQFIVTAHSPLVVQSAPDANIVVLKKVGDHVEIENDPVSVKTWRVDQILSSELFGGISPRAEAVEALLQERRELLGKRELTAEERARAAELEVLVAEVPHVESAAEIKAMRLMEEITEKLKGGL
jgi:predicted ATP-binding protein involved in virulence